MPVPYEIQLEGVMQFATVDAAGVSGTFTDYSSELMSLVIGRTRNTVERPPTYADARRIKRAAELVEQVTLNFIGDFTNATGLMQLLWTALGTAPCNLAFRAVYKTGTVTATNPGYSGFLTVVDLDTGAAAGEATYQSKTFPAFGIARVIAPFS